MAAACTQAGVGRIAEPIRPDTDRSLGKNRQKQKFTFFAARTAAKSYLVRNLAKNLAKIRTLRDARLRR